MTNYGSLTLVLLAFSWVGVAAAQDEKPAEEKKKDVVKLSGTFEPISPHKIAAETKQFTALKIKRIVAHGAAVKKGQPLVWFETEGIDKKIADTEHAVRLADLTLAELTLEAKQIPELLVLDREQAKRSQRNFAQDYDYYVGTSKPQRIEQTEQGLKSAEFSLESAAEELKQLEQMYREDELTEESEEIVLRRARRAVESAQMRLRHSRTSTQQSLERTIPREAEAQDDALARAKLAHDKSMQSLDVSRRRRELEIANEKKSIAQKKADFEELRADRQRMVLTSPIDGTVYHGQFTRGALGAKPSELKEGAAATATAVLATVVNPRALAVRIDLPEKELAHVRVGSKATVMPTGMPDVKISGVVKSISSIPIAAGKFDCLMNIKLPKDSAPVAGMTCSVEIAK